mgnify:CR=1 FL=1
MDMLKLSCMNLKDSMRDLMHLNFDWVCRMMEMVEIHWRMVQLLLKGFSITTSA